MRLPAVLPSVQDGRRELHVLDLPPCCPVSKNPRPGSKLVIRYKPCGLVLEVGALYAYIHQYKGGLRDEAGTLLVRDMEGMVSMIRQHCSEVLGVPVQVKATLLLAPRQEMRVVLS